MLLVLLLIFIPCHYYYYQPANTILRTSLRFVSIYFILSQIIEDMECKKKYANKKKTVSTYRKKKGIKKKAVSTISTLFNLPIIKRIQILYSVH